MKSTRLLIYAPVIGRGGVHRLVENLVPAMLKIADSKKMEIKILSHSRDENGAPIHWPQEQFTPLQPPLWDLASPTRRLQYLAEGSSKYYSQLASLWQAGDVVWLPHPWFSLRISHSLISRAPVHFVPTIHDMAFDSLNWGGAWGAAYRHEMFAFALLGSRLIFSSNAMSKIAIERYGFNPHKARTVYLGNFLPANFNTSEEVVAKVRTLYELPKDYLLAFHCSSPSKDLLTIIKALRINRTRNSSASIPLVIAGIGTERFNPNHPDKDDYTLAVHEAIRDAHLELDKDLFILGGVPDDLIGGLYAGATASVTASLSEAGLSGTLFESFYAHCPAIFTDIPQFTERLGTEKVYGLHFRKGDAAELARTLDELIANPQKRAARAQKAYELVNERTWQHIAQDYLDVFQSLEDIDPNSLRQSQIPRERLRTYLDVKARFFQFRTVRFMRDRFMPKLRLSTHERRMQAETIVNEVTLERNIQRTRIEVLEQQNKMLQRKVDSFNRLKHNITTDLLNKYVTSGSGIHTESKVDQLDDKIQAIKSLLHHPDLPLDVLATLGKNPEVLDQAYHSTLLPLYEDRVGGENSNFWDIRMALNVLGRVLQPQHYLEIGTRLGWSLSQVLAHSPQTQVYSFDMWVQEYAGLKNPGSDFVQNIMSRITTPVIPQITFISGNSHDTLPQFFNPERYIPSFPLPTSRPTSFDLITVDGDHNLEGAWMDLVSVMPHIAVGGAVVFDDMELSLTNSDIQVHSETQYPDYYPPMPQGLKSLRDVWNAVKNLFPNYVYIESGDQPIAVGIGIRLS